MGTLYGVSVGTGDTELITVKGVKILQRSPIVAFPAGVKGKVGIAQKIIQPWLQPEQTTLALNFPYVSDRLTLESAWEVAAKAVLDYLLQGQDVAFACEGDISFYSTFNHLARTIKQLQASVKIITIPGVCSPVAAAADLGIPLTVNQEKILIIPALYAVEDLETALASAEVIVLLKVSSVYQQVWQILKLHNLLAQSSVVVKASSQESKQYQDLTDYPDLELPYFSLLIVSRIMPT